MSDSESDPKRLLEEGGDDLGVTLLRAGRTLDAERARERKIAVLGAVGAGAAAGAVLSASAAKGATHALSALTVKWIGLGVLAAVVTGAAALLLIARPDASSSPLERGVTVESAAAPSPSAALDAPGQAREASPDSAIAPPSPNSPENVANSVEQPADPAARAGDARSGDDAKGDERAPGARAEGSSGRAAVKPRPVGEDARPAEGPSLAEEVEALKKAREALAAGRPKRALTALNAYEQRFRGGRLSLEAEVLRIEALARSGEAEAARARAASFLAAHPSSPYAVRVRAVLTPPRGEAGDDGARPIP